MSVPSSALQKKIEERLRDFLKGTIAADGYTFFAAHDTSKQAPADVNIIVVHAAIPDFSAAQGEAAEIHVTIYPVTNVADPADRSGAAAQHQQVMGDILDVFAYENFQTSLATLNGIQDGLGFDGWEFQPDSEDGQSPTEKSLSPKLKYIFEVFLFDV